MMHTAKVTSIALTIGSFVSLAGCASSEEDGAQADTANFTEANAQTGTKASEKKSAPPLANYRCHGVGNQFSGFFAGPFEVVVTAPTSPTGPGSIVIKGKEEVKTELKTIRRVRPSGDEVMDRLPESTFFSVSIESAKKPEAAGLTNPALVDSVAFYEGEKHSDEPGVGTLGVYLMRFFQGDKEIGGMFGVGESHAMCRP